MHKWLSFFQKEVNIVTGYKGLVFTVSIRGPPKSRGCGKFSFPFLDMKMTWSEEGDLRFGVYLKPGQEMKYLQRQLPSPSLLQSDYERRLGSTGKSDLVDERIPVHVHQGLIPSAPQST
jgi:hypothetical protein